MASSRLTALPQPSCHTLGTRKPGRHFSHWEAYPHFTDRKLRLSANKILGPVGHEGTGRLQAFPAALRAVRSGVLRLELGISTGLPDPGVDAPWATVIQVWGPLGAQAAPTHACWRPLAAFG